MPPQFVEYLGRGHSQEGLMLEWVKDRGESECLAVMAGIGDETIALTRKGADFHEVACRKIGL